MTQIIHCSNCVHYINDLKCEAFPEGIPDEILEGLPHIKPYKGDGGITFEIDRNNESAYYLVQKFGTSILKTNKKS